MCYNESLSLLKADSLGMILRSITASSLEMLFEEIVFPTFS